MNAIKTNNEEGKKFPPVFSEALESFAKNVAKSLNCNIDYVYSAMLVAASIAIGSKKKIEIKKGWQESALLFLILVGEPGSKKTPAITQAIKPIINIQKKLLGKTEDFSSKIIEAILTTDSTVESLAELMFFNPHGILLFKDEAIGWFKSMNQYKSGGDDTEKYLSIFSQTILVVNRKGKQPVQVNNPFLTFIGGIQVDILDSLSSMKDNGFLDRILFSFPKTIAIEHSDTEIDEDLEKKYEDTINYIYETSVKGNEKILMFSDNAKERWVQWHIKFCNLANSDSLPFYLKGALSKIEAYTARFALILQHLNSAEAGVEPEVIDVKSLNGAIEIINYFIQNVTKVRDSYGSSLVDKKIEKVFNYIKKNGGTVNSRKLYTNRVAAIKNSQEVFELFSEMRARGLGQIFVNEDGFRSGQKTCSFMLNRKFITPLQNNTKNE